MSSVWSDDQWLVEHSGATLGKKGADEEDGTDKPETGTKRSAEESDTVRTVMVIYRKSKFILLLNVLISFCF